MYGETRSSPRLPCQARFLGAAARTVRGEIRDVSTSGLCLTVDAPLEVGKELHLDFELPAGQVEAVGEVRWVVTKNGVTEVGIRFVRISAESSAVIQRAVAPAQSGIWWSRVA